MTLATHMVTGAAAAQVFASHPAEAFVVGWVSHYVLDSIPHWDYKLRAYSGDRQSGLNTKLTLSRDVFGDIAKVLFDALLGFVFILLAVGPLTPDGSVFLFLAAIGGAFPDFLQFLYVLLKKSRLLQILQRFHFFIHARVTLDNRPTLGIFAQVLIILIMVGLLL